MPLKLEVESLEGLDESIQGLYEREGEEGPYRLAVEGLPDTQGLKSALEKERAAAKDLKKQLKSFEGVDTEKYQNLLLREAEFEKADPSKIEEMINERVSQNKKQWDEKYLSLQEAYSQRESQLADLTITNELRSVGAELGVADGEAMNDFIARGKGVFRLVDGKVTPVDKEGNVLYGESGVEPLTMREYTKKLSETAKHLFKPSAGGGASNAGGGNTGRGTVRFKSDLRTNADKAAFIGKHGRTAYLELPAAPDKAS